MESKRTKPRERVANPAQYAKKQRRKAAAKELHRNMSISRKARNTVGNFSFQHTVLVNRGVNKNLIINLCETPKTDRILFKVYPFGKNRLLKLPVINDVMLIKYSKTADGAPVEREEAIRKYALEELGIVAESIKETDHTVVFTGCKKVRKKSDCVVLDVKDYERCDWIVNKGEPSLRGRKVYSGSEIKEYIILRDNVKNTRIHFDTLYEIYDYRCARRGEAIV